MVAVERYSQFESSNKDEEYRMRSLTYAGEILTTPDLVLRALREDDVPHISKLANNYQIASMLEAMPYPYFDEDARKFLQMIANPKTGECVFGITSARNSELMGICGLHLTKRRFDLPHMGYWLGEEYWGRGYATQAASALVDLFFKAGSEDTLLISVLEENTASRRVIEKCGGRFWKQEENYSNFFKENRKVDHFRITREDWMGTHTA